MNRLLLFLLLLSTASYAQSWVPLGGIPNGRHHPVGFALNGKGYMATGTNSVGQPSKDFYEYDPVSDTWQTLTDFPGIARSFAIGVVLDGKAYMGFGATNTSYLRDFWRYDAQTDQWTQLSSCGCSGRRHPAMIAIGNRIYVGLGDGVIGDLNDWWMYTVDTDSWVNIADLPGPPRHHPFQFNAGGEVFAGLGHRGNSIYRDWYKLDTASNTWTAMQLFPGEGRVAGTQFDWNDDGFILSGDGDDHSFMATGEMWRYSPGTDSWTQFTPHPGISRWAPGSFVINDEVYFFGGLNRQVNQYPTDMWKFDLLASTIGISEKSETKPFVFPNPAADFIRWQSEKPITNAVLYNAVGQKIHSVKTDLNQIDIRELEGGIYVLKLYAGMDLIQTTKVLIQH